MKTLILPAEIKTRELDARLLHAVLALDAGWRVITGSKALINRNIWRIPRGIYLMQTMTHKRLFMAKLLTRLGFKIQGWDEEGLVYLDRELYLTRRISSETAQYISEVFTWGPQGAKDIKQRSCPNIYPAGNPRFDLLRPEARSIYFDEVAEIQKNHGDFILINTNFSSVNPIISLHDAPERAISAKDKPSGDKIKQQYDGFLDHRREMFKAFCDLLPELSRRFPDRVIVVRPHPAEELETWNKLFNDNPNIRIIRKGSSIPWLLASKVLIHNGCTTAIESRLLGNSPVAYAPVSSDAHESPLPNGISHMAVSKQQLFELVEQALAGNLSITQEQQAVLDNYVSGLDGPMAAQTALNHAERLAATMQNPSVSACFLRFLAVFRHLYKNLRHNHRTDRYLEKVFPVTSASEITDRANQLASILKLDCAGQITTNNISTNIFELRVK